MKETRTVKITLSKGEWSLIEQVGRENRWSIEETIEEIIITTLNLGWAD